MPRLYFPLVEMSFNRLWRRSTTVGCLVANAINRSIDHPSWSGDKLELLFLMCFDKCAAGLKQSPGTNEVLKFMSTWGEVCWIEEGPKLFTLCKSTAHAGQATGTDCLHNTKDIKCNWISDIPSHPCLGYLEFSFKCATSRVTLRNDLFS